MTLEEIMHRINNHRAKHGLSLISIQTRPSKSKPGARTIEVVGNGDVLKKSLNGGAINFYLSGMLQAYQDKPIESIANFRSDITTGTFIRNVEY